MGSNRRIQEAICLLACHRTLCTRHFMMMMMMLMAGSASHSIINNLFYYRAWYARRARGGLWDVLCKHDVHDAHHYFLLFFVSFIRRNMRVSLYIASLYIWPMVASGHCLHIFLFASIYWRQRKKYVFIYIILFI